MLKKIVKYGNSYVLRLDRTIMSLLNLEDDGLVKLKIEGDTLIIKPAKNIKSSEAILTEFEEFSNNPSCNFLSPFIENNKQELKQKLKENPQGTEEELKEWAPGGEKRTQMDQFFKKKFENFQFDLKGITSKEAIDEFTNLKNDLNSGKISIEEYKKSIMEARKKYIPGIEEFDKETMNTLKDIQDSNN